MGLFFASPPSGVLRQGEIVSEVVQVHIRAESLDSRSEDLDLEEKAHPYALILTQDCDLDWDFKARATTPENAAQENKRQAKLVPNILLCELSTVDSLKPRLAGGDVLRRIRSNQDERYHFLPSVTPSGDLIGEGLPELVADFKRVFCIPTDELYLRLNIGMRRRAILENPFLHHLSSRFGYYCLRVALPEDSGGELHPAPVPTLLPVISEPENAAPTAPTGSSVAF